MPCSLERCCCSGREERTPSPSTPDSSSGSPTSTASRRRQSDEIAAVIRPLGLVKRAEMLKRLGTALAEAGGVPSSTRRADRVPRRRSLRCPLGAGIRAPAQPAGRRLGSGTRAEALLRTARRRPAQRRRAALGSRGSAREPGAPATCGSPPSTWPQLSANHVHSARTVRCTGHVNAPLRLGPVRAKPARAASPARRRQDAPQRPAVRRCRFAWRSRSSCLRSGTRRGTTACAPPRGA